ncbi:putative ABC transporter ATP-binding protein [Clostridia bacterium]|nr:putative ABC transporter ATP-binding protein [Clostridia bacterium]
MVTATDLSVRYDKNTSAALDCVNINIADGERVALIGANGAGKSTLLLAVAGVLKPHEGAVAAPPPEDLGVLFQNPDDQLFMPTVAEDVAFTPKNRGEAFPDIEKILETLGILHLKERMTHRLSGGEKRLVALAGVLITRPSLLLLDEPSSFLDPRARRNLIDILGTLTQTMLVATHDLDLALDLCQRVIILENGKIRADAGAEILQDIPLLKDCGLEPPLSYSA